MCVGPCCSHVVAQGWPAKLQCIALHKSKLKLYGGADSFFFFFKLFSRALNGKLIFESKAKGYITDQLESSQTCSQARCLAWASTDAIAEALRY